tara:strand:- start:160 stop:627 length:468 start_codon:yes stop_codon:yes gene_type:complete
MYPLRHFFYGLIFSLFLFLLFPEIGLIEAAIILASSVLIDVDHYIYHIFKKRIWSLKQAYKNSLEEFKIYMRLSKTQQKNIYTGIFFLHGIEVLLILLLLGFFVSDFFNYVFVGFSFHLLLDILFQSTYKENIDKISLIKDILTSKKLTYIGDLK